MKKILFLLAAFFVFTGTSASSLLKPPSLKATEIFLPIGRDMKISLIDLSIISVKIFKKLQADI